MAHCVEDILGADALTVDGGDSLRSIEVNKPIDCELDLGELLVVDPNAIEDYKLKYVHMTKLFSDNFYAISAIYAT